MLTRIATVFTVVKLTSTHHLQRSGRFIMINPWPAFFRPFWVGFPYVQPTIWGDLSTNLEKQNHTKPPRGKNECALILGDHFKRTWTIFQLSIFGEYAFVFGEVKNKRMPIPNKNKKGENVRPLPKCVCYPPSRVFISLVWLIHPLGPTKIYEANDSSAQAPASQRHTDPKLYRKGQVGRRWHHKEDVVDQRPKTSE